MSAITRISVLTSFALLFTAAISATDASACPRGGYINSYSYYGPSYGYGSQFGFRRIPQTTVVKPGIPGPITPAVTPVPNATPAPAIAPSPAPEVAPPAAPITPPAASITPGPAPVSPNQVPVQDAAPVASNAPPVSPNQSLPRIAAP